MSRTAFEGLVLDDIGEDDQRLVVYSGDEVAYLWTWGMSAKGVKEGDALSIAHIVWEPQKKELQFYTLEHPCQLIHYKEIMQNLGISTDGISIGQPLLALPQPE